MEYTTQSTNYDPYDDIGVVESRVLYRSTVDDMVAQNPVHLVGYDVYDTETELNNLLKQTTLGSGNITQSLTYVPYSNLNQQQEDTLIRDYAKEFGLSDYMKNKKIQVDGAYTDRPNGNGYDFDAHAGMLIDDKTNYMEMRTNLFMNTPLSIHYYSPQNIAIIRNEIHRRVSSMVGSKHQFVDVQTDEDLQGNMTEVFRKYSHTPFNGTFNSTNELEDPEVLIKKFSDNVPTQLNQLNEQVIRRCIPKVYEELLAIIQFRHNMDTPYMPMEYVKQEFKDKTLKLDSIF